jgi:hypothetical protein
MKNRLAGRCGRRGLWKSCGAIVSRDKRRERSGKNKIGNELTYSKGVL